MKPMSSVLKHLDHLKESGFSEDQAKAIVSINQDTKEHGNPIGYKKRFRTA